MKVGDLVRLKSANKLYVIVAIVKEADYTQTVIINSLSNGKDYFVKLDWLVKIQ